MKIAFVSYEYPPETALGGIATYVEQAALMLAERGHQIEVFTAGEERDRSFEQEGILVHRLCSRGRTHFHRELFPHFLRRHRESPFDVVESPDYKHDGCWIAKKIPSLAHVLRLHSGTVTSLFLFETATAPQRSRGTRWRHSLSQFRALAGAAKRGMPWRDYEGFCDYATDIWNENILDRRTAEAADLIVSPSLDLLQFQQKTWNLDPRKLAHLAYPYRPSPSLLEIPCGARGKTVGFFGQLSERKGLRALGHALPLIFQREPGASFIFVGRNLGMSDGTPAPDFLRRQAGTFADRLEFTGQVALRDMPREYSRVDLCVFPSIWENFPNVCLEAMSAGRAVAASERGGMSEMLDAGRCGLLFPPESPDRLAEAVLQLLGQPELCLDFGWRARKRVLEHYSREKIGPQQEKLYQQAIEMRRRRLHQGAS